MITTLTLFQVSVVALAAFATLGGCVNSPKTCSDVPAMDEWRATAARPTLVLAARPYSAKVPLNETVSFELKVCHEPYGTRTIKSELHWRSPILEPASGQFNMTTRPGEVASFHLEATAVKPGNWAVMIDGFIPEGRVY